MGVRKRREGPLDALEQVGPRRERLGDAREVAHERAQDDPARRAAIAEIAIEPNLGIIHASTDDHAKIHQQLEIVWNLDTIRSLGCPILLYAARKPERLARIMMASAVLHARADYIRTHTPEMIWRLHQEGSGA